MVRIYLNGVKARARFAIWEACRSVTFIDMVCVGAVAFALFAMVSNPFQYQMWAGGVFAPQNTAQAVRALLVALGCLILVDRRTNNNFIKVAITFIVVGYASDITEGLTSGHPSIQLGALISSAGIFIWFLSILFKTPYTRGK